MNYLFPITFLFATLVHAGEEWEPEVGFQLESRSYMETLIWVSGISYTLSELLQNSKLSYCSAPKSIGSKQLLGYLNKQHSQENISAEQAIETIISQLNNTYPCK